MNFLLKKMIRSIQTFWVQFLAVLLMAVLSVFVYAGLEGAWCGMQKEFDEFVNETNLADEWVSASYFTEEDIMEFENVIGVSDLSVKIRIMVNANIDEDDAGYLSLDTTGNNEITRPYIVCGSSVDEDAYDAIWLDEDYAKSHNLTVGDSISISYGDIRMDLTIEGLILSSEHIQYLGTQEFYSPDHLLFGYGIISNNVIDELKIPIYGNLLAIKSENSDVSKKAPEILGDRYISYYNRDSLPDVSRMSTQIGNIKRLSILFSALFILLSALSMNTTIKRLIDAQASDISTLKALGYSNSKLGFYYASYGFFVGTIGSLVGLAISPFFSQFVEKTQKVQFAIPSWSIAHTWKTYGVVGLIIFLCTITSVIASKPSRSGLPADFAKNQKKVRYINILEKIGFIWNKMGFGERWAWRDGQMHITRILMGIISICGSIMLLMAGFGTPDAVSALSNRAYKNEFTYAYRVQVDTSNTATENEALQEELEGQWIETVQVRLFTDASMKEMYYKILTVFSEGDYIQLRDEDGKFLAEEGAYVTEGIANDLDIKIGDTLYMAASLDEGIKEVEVVGIVESSMPQSIYLMEDTWHNIGGTFVPSHLMTGELENIENIKSDSRILQVISSKQQEKNLTKFQDVLNGTFMLMRAMAILLVVIVLYNLSTLSFTERIKEYTTFRVLGFRYVEIRHLASLENIVILCIGLIVGIPAGIKFLSVYCNTFSSDSLLIYPEITPMSFCIVCLLVIVSTILTTLLLSRKIRKIDMVEALKGVE